MNKPSIEWAIRTLRQPAGSDARFATLEAIEQNRDDFIRTFHDSLKELQATAITTILLMDRELKIRSQSSESIEAARLYRQIWRRVNDTIAWTLLGHRRYVVKRLCHFRKRDPLLNQGIRSVTKYLDELNSNPYGVALLTDATSFIDIGDILYSDQRSGQTSIIEVKSGKLSESFLSKAPNLNETVAQLDKHDAKQLARFARQAQRMLRTVELLNTDKGIDPLSGQPMRLLDCAVPDQDYDEELQGLLAGATSGGGKTRSRRQLPLDICNTSGRQSDS